MLLVLQLLELCIGFRETRKNRAAADVLEESAWMLRHPRVMGGKDVEPDMFLFGKYWLSSSSLVECAINASTWACHLNGAQKQPRLLPCKCCLASALSSVCSGAIIQLVYCRITDSRLAVLLIWNGLPQPYDGWPVVCAWSMLFGFACGRPTCMLHVLW